MEDIIFRQCSIVYVKCTKELKPLLEAAEVKGFSKWQRVYMQVDAGHVLSIKKDSYSKPFYQLLLTDSNFSISGIRKSKDMNFLTLKVNSMNLPNVMIGCLTKTLLSKWADSFNKISEWYEGKLELVSQISDFDKGYNRSSELSKTSNTLISQLTQKQLTNKKKLGSHSKTFKSKSPFTKYENSKGMKSLKQSTKKFNYSKKIHFEANKNFSDFVTKDRRILNSDLATPEIKLQKSKSSVMKSTKNTDHSLSQVNPVI